MAGKIYLIDDQEYSLKKTTLKDYKSLNALLKENGSGLSLDISSDEKLLVGIGKLINDLLESGSIEKFLSIILIQAPGNNRIPTPTSPAEVAEVEDTVLVEIVTDFFYSKKELIENITNSFKSLKKSTNEPTGSSKD